MRFEIVLHSYLSSGSNVGRMSVEHGGIRGRVWGVVGGHSGWEVREACRSFTFVSQVAPSLTVSLCSLFNVDSQKRYRLTTGGPEGGYYAHRWCKEAIKSES